MASAEIRARALWRDPAAISTELLDKIADRQTAEGMKGLYDTFGISPDRIADVVADALDLLQDTTVSEFTVGPVRQSW